MTAADGCQHFFVNRYQEHGERLQVENIKLAEELETQKLNLRDINEFLTNELKARSLTTSALEGKVYELQGLIDEVKKQHEVRYWKTRMQTHFVPLSDIG